MKKHILIIALLCMLILSGCADKAKLSSADESSESSAASAESSEYTSTESICPIEPDETSCSVEGTDYAAIIREGAPLCEELLAQYQDLFDQSEVTWYNQALTSLYTTAEELDLEEFFLGGIRGVDNTLSEEEQNFMKPVWDSYGACTLDTFRLPAEKMDEILQEYFGISLDQTKQNGLDQLPYFEETDCYYIYTGEFNSIQVRPHSGYQLADGTIALYYETSMLNGTEEEYVVTLRPTDHGILVVSNLPANEGP